MALSPTLLSDSSFVLLHGNFKNNLANLLCKDYGKQIKPNLEKMLEELNNFSIRLNSVDKTLNAVKDFIKSERLEASKFFPKQYFNNGFEGADDLFFYLKIQDPQGYWIGAIYLFFPHLFLEKSLSDELRCCSFREGFTGGLDVRFCEVFSITYYEPSLS